MTETYHAAARPDEARGAAADLRPLSVEELAELTGWSRRLCWDLARRRELPCIRAGRRVYFPRPAVMALLAQGAAPQAGEEAGSV